MITRHTLLVHLVLRSATVNRHVQNLLWPNDLREMTHVVDGFNEHITSFLLPEAHMALYVCVCMSSARSCYIRTLESPTALYAALEPTTSPPSSSLPPPCAYTMRLRHLVVPSLEHVHKP